MLSASEFREIVSDRKSGFRAALWRGLFATIEPFYSAAVRYRNWRFDTGRIPIARMEVPVVSVGNLTLGGTGKTPMVEWLARWFTDRGVCVALVSRGYGAVDGLENDEAKELHQKLPSVPHLLTPKRAVGAREAIDRYGAQLIILDDGFQHRSLARDLDIVLVDAIEPYGFGHVFPRGTLREPLAGFARAQVIALSRSDALGEKARQAIQARVTSYNRTAIWLELSHVPQGVRGSGGDRQPLDHLYGKRLLAFCGIGNPAGFRRALEQCGYGVVDIREFPDHHAYSPGDLSKLDHWAEQAKADTIVCTHKDLVKIGQPRIGARPLWALEIRLAISRGQADLESQLSLLASRALGQSG